MAKKQQSKTSTYKSKKEKELEAKLREERLQARSTMTQTLCHRCTKYPDGTEMNVYWYVYR